MNEYTFEQFRAALALLNEAVSQAGDYQQAALSLAKMQANPFFNFIFMNYISEIENQITEGISEMLSTFDPPIDEEA